MTLQKNQKAKKKYDEIDINAGAKSVINDAVLHSSCDPNDIVYENFFTEKISAISRAIEKCRYDINQKAKMSLDIKIERKMQNMDEINYKVKIFLKEYIARTSQKLENLKNLKQSFDKTVSNEKFSSIITFSNQILQKNS